MDIRTITPAYSVSPQIDPADIDALVAAGFRKIICNRPDAEIPPSHHASVMEQAATAAGLEFVTIPVTHQGLNAEMVAAQREALDTADGPVLAYCASGTRSTIVWALGQAGDLPAEEIIGAAATAGYDIAGLKPQLQAMGG